MTLRGFLPVFRAFRPIPRIGILPALAPDAGFNIRHEDTSMQRFAVRSAVLIAVLFLAAPASAQVVQSAQVGVGAVFPRGFDTRVPGDTLVANVTNANPLAFGGMSEFTTAQINGEWNVTFGDRVEFGAGVGFQKRTVPSVYRDWLNEDRTEIVQALRLRVVPVTAVVRFLPFGRPHNVQPYVGGGFGVFNYRYSEVGQFMDTTDLSIFSERYTVVGNAPGAVVLGGVRMPLGGDIYGLTMEYRYTIASGDTGGAANGFLGDKIDLSGGQLNFGFLVRF